MPYTFYIITSQFNHNIIDKTASIQKMNLQKGFLRVAAKITNITVSAIIVFSLIDLP
jgi:hypothetical protein